MKCPGRCSTSKSDVCRCTFCHGARHSSRLRASKHASQLAQPYKQLSDLFLGAIERGLKAKMKGKR